MELFLEIWKHFEKIQSMDDLSTHRNDSTIDQTLIDNVQHKNKTDINNSPSETHDLIDLDDGFSSRNTMSIVSAMNNSDRSITCSSMKKSDESLEESTSDSTEKKLTVSSIFSYQDSSTKSTSDHSKIDADILEQSIKYSETSSVSVHHLN